MIPFVFASFFVLFSLPLSAGVHDNSTRCEVGTTFCAHALQDDVCCRTSIGEHCCGGMWGGHCCHSGSTCCGEMCCSSGMCCGNECCPGGGTCCGALCCLPGWQCCAGICCESLFETCDSKSGRCVLAEASDTRQTEEINVEPSDPAIVYSGEWSSTGGTCTSGTRTTFQVKANFTYKVRGIIKLTTSFIPKDQAVNVSVLTNGYQRDTFIFGGSPDPQCRQSETWSRGFYFSELSDNEISFTFEGPVSSLAGSSLTRKRAPVALELAQITYVKGMADGRISASVFAVTLATSATVMLLTGIYFA